ncbi:zinc finger protein [Trichuris trichiura]|uniref:Zinc finger protein n=1 Tax=Trichuris trichiura TaxID=36087 RepID=A0A077ZIN4_TRITR|nr:zinc finger protein [Trichuris trichiura]
MDAGESEVPPGAEIIEIDAAQLEQLLVLGDGAAEFVDQHGNTIRLTAEELIEAGFTADSLEESSLSHMDEVSTYADTSGGEYYVIGRGDHEPPRLELAAEPLSSGTMNESGSTEESQSDKPPVLSASVPLGPGGRCVPSDPQDVKELRALYEEYAKELKEKDNAIVTQNGDMKRLEERALLTANALVKNVSLEEAEVFLDAHDMPGSVTAATVSVKRARQEENAPEEALVVHLDSGENCFVVAQDLSGQPRAIHSGTTDIAKPEEEKEPEWELMDVGKRNETLTETDRVQGGEHKCTICFKDFPTYFSAGRHVKEDHMITDEQRLLTLVIPSRNVDFVISKCEVCERTFSKPEFLERHKIAHTDAMPYACKLCPQRYKWKENLQKHMTTHGSRANFKCPDCNQVFYSQTRVDIHYKASGTLLFTH